MGSEERKAQPVKPEAKPSKNGAPKKKKKYTTPHVARYGHVSKITEGSGGMKGDFGNNMSRM